MASDEEGRRSVSRWSEFLPDEFLELIVKKLTRASDYLRFRCVCESWRSIAKPTNLPPHLPLLILPYHPSTEHRSVFSVSSRQIHILSIPELVNKVILTASRGWLLLLDVAPAGGRLFLLNPLTGAEIQLPPTDGFFHERRYEFSPVHRKFLTIKHGTDSTLDLLNYRCIFPWLAFLLSSPNTAPTDCMVVIAGCYACPSNVAFCKLGDELWTVLDTGLFGMLLSVAHHEGSLYMTDLKGDASVCEIASPLNPKPIGLPDDPEYLSYHPLFISTSSQLLLLDCFHNDIIHVCSDEEDGVYELGRFKMHYKIHELMPGNPPGWSLVESIHDKTVFRAYRARQNVVVCTRDIPGGQEDCSAYDIDVLDLEAENVEHLSFGWMEPDSEKLLHPLWVELSLCTMLE